MGNQRALFGTSPWAVENSLHGHPRVPLLLRDENRAVEGRAEDRRRLGPDLGGRTVFRELVRERDGSIGTAFVDEMIPQKPLLALERVLLKGTCGISVRQIGVFPHSFRLDGSIRFRPGTAEFGIIVMDQEQIYRRFISFDPQSGLVELDDFTRIRQVEMDGGEVSFRLVRTADVLDLEINGRRTVVSSHLDFPESSVALYVRDGEAEFSGLKSFVR